LEGAATASGAKFDRAAMEQILAGLGNRVFLLNNVHEDAPVLFQTRWTLSYLRGPMARPEIRKLMEGRAPQAAAAGAAASAQTVSTVPEGASATAPVLPPDVAQFFVPLSGGVLHYEPRVLGAAQVQFTDTKLGVNEVRDAIFGCPITDAAVPVDWSQAEAVEVPLNDLEKAPSEGATFAELPPAGAKAKNYAAWQKSFATWLYQTQSLELLRSPSTGDVSRLGESERDFRIRTQQSAREARDAQVEKLRAQYAPKAQMFEDRLRRAQVKLEQEKQQAQAQTLSSVLSIGTSLLGAFMGRKTISAANVGRIGTAARAATRIGKERGDVGLAEGSVEAIQQQLQDLEAQRQAEIDAIPMPGEETLEKVTVKPKKTGISVQLCALAWM
jgi:hypothetical protein